MSTKKQIAANRSNALKSPGPRSPEGKQTSSGNATTHGLFAKHLQLRQEDQPVFFDFQQQIQAEYQPQGPTECFYVELVIDQGWRWRCCLGLETDLFEWYRVFKNVKGGVGTAFAHDAGQGNCLTRLSRYARRFERGFRKALAELRKLQERRGCASTQSQNPVTPVTAAPLPGNPPSENPGASQPAQAASPVSLASAKTLAEQVVLSDEDPKAFNDHVQALVEEWQPQSATKAFFVELFAVTSWRMIRASRLEADLFEHYRVYGKVEGDPITALVQDAAELDCFSKLEAYETGLRNSLTLILNQLLA